MTDSILEPGNSGSPEETSTLAEIRVQITEVDDNILSLLAQRRKLSRDVAINKASSQKPVRDQQREVILLEALIDKGSAAGLDSYYVTSLFQSIIEDSLMTQKEYLQSHCNSQEERKDHLNIAVLGGKGAYSYLAACKYFRGNNNAFLACSSFEKIFKSIEQNRVDYGIIPIENSTSGAITEVYDLLSDSSLTIVGEEKYQIDHCLAGQTETKRHTLNKIYAHPEAARQCSKQLKNQLSAEICLVSSTAEALKQVRKDKTGRVAAIASEKSSIESGLKILLKGIANSKDNTTRFLILARTPQKVSQQLNSKTSIAFSTGQKPGSLAEVLLIFKDAELPLNRLESRPITGKSWEQMFYLDFSGNIASENVINALDAVAKICHFIKILGCYPSEDNAVTNLSASALSKNRYLKSLPDEQSSDEPCKNNEKCQQKEPYQPETNGYRLASRQHKKENTVVEVKGVQFGSDGFIVLAGPPAIENEQQITDCARHAKETGVAILSGGCFKPPTTPEAFSGLGFEGLNYLKQAGEKYALPVMTEIIDTDSLSTLRSQADLLQISARNMQNYALLKAVGQTNIPVMLKRGHMSSIEELLNAADYILSHGNQQVILCEQGSRTFETATRNTLDFSAIPLIRQISHLPVIVYPSHAVGKRELVIPMAKAARAVGAHGILVDFHPKPESALCGAQQALDFNNFAKMMYQIHAPV